jgi:hypothetical protein
LRVSRLNIAIRGMSGLAEGRRVIQRARRDGADGFVERAPDKNAGSRGEFTGGTGRCRRGRRPRWFRYTVLRERAVYVTNSAVNARAHKRGPRRSKVSFGGAGRRPARKSK